MSKTILVLGVTGGIATGKSTVVQEFARLGATVVCADSLAREVVQPGQPALEALVAFFGPETLDARGELNRPWLAERIFQDEEARARLNQITHPAIAQLADKRLHQAKVSGASLVVYDAPLLFEAGADRQVDQTLVVFARKDLQLARLMTRDGLSRTEAQQRIEAQWSLEQKRALADYQIDNSGDLTQTMQAVRRLFERLTNPHESGKTSD